MVQMMLIFRLGMGGLGWKLWGESAALGILSLLQPEVVLWCSSMLLLVGFRVRGLGSFRTFGQ